MSAYDTDRASYTPNDFLLWQTNGILVITPKFQRRPVWKTPARSLFIDTMLRGMTVPPLYMRLTQSEDKKKKLREVVDGQQRIRSIIEFIGDNGYRLSKTLSAPWAGKRFADLGDEQQQQIMNFGFATETYKGISDQEVLEVFSRLNMNGIPLNKQELRNGKFFGLFKQTSYSLALAYLDFWRKHNIFTEQNIARMLEAELTSELLIAGNAGMQDKKTTIDEFYDKWEEKYQDQDRDKKRFTETMGVISETFENDALSETAFRRAPLFYSLYCVVYHYIFGLPDMQRTTPRRKLSVDERNSLKSAVIKLSELIGQAKEPEADTPRKYVPFIAACQRQTDNLMPRKVRFNTLFDEAF